MRGDGHREYDCSCTLLEAWGHQISAHAFPHLDGTTGSIELGIFDESERVRTRGSQAHSRPSWPLSARFLVGAMLVLNILLAAFLVRTEIKRPEAPAPGAPATSTPLNPQPPKADSTPQPNAPPDQGSSQGASQGASQDQGSGSGLEAPPVEATPAAVPSTQRSKRPAIKALPKALRASKPSGEVWSARMPRAVDYPPPEPLVRTPAPVRNPAASSSAIANVAPPARAPSFGIPGAGVPSSAGPHPNAPAASTFAPSAIDRALTAKGTRPGSVAKVASVGLPAMEKGVVMPTRPVASVSPKIEIVPRPPVKLENCGDDKVFVACPTLKIRYDTPYTSVVP